MHTVQPAVLRSVGALSEPQHVPCICYNMQHKSCGCVASSSTPSFQVHTQRQRWAESRCCCPNGRVFATCCMHMQLSCLVSFVGLLSGAAAMQASVSSNHILCVSKGGSSTFEEQRCRRLKVHMWLHVVCGSVGMMLLLQSAAVPRMDAHRM